MCRLAFALREMSQDVIARLLVREDLNLCTKPAHFFDHNRTHTIHGSLVMRWGFSFDEGFEQRCIVHAFHKVLGSVPGDRPDQQAVIEKETRLFPR